MNLTGSFRTNPAVSAYPSQTLPAFTHRLQDGRPSSHLTLRRLLAFALERMTGWGSG